MIVGVLAILAACIPAPVEGGDSKTDPFDTDADSDTDTDADADADSDTDTDTDTDTDADSDSDADADTGPCPSFAGFGAAGRVRGYDTTASYESSGNYGSWTMTTRSVGATTELIYASTFVSSGIESEGTATYVYACDTDGASLVEFTSESSFVYEGTRYSNGFVATYTDPYLGVVHDMAPGTTWSDTWAYTAEGWSSTREDWTTSASGYTGYTVGSATTKTVPAGTYDTLPLASNTTIDGNSYPDTTWFDSDVGMVLSSTGELVSVR